MERKPYRGSDNRARRAAPDRAGYANRSEEARRTRDPADRYTQPADRYSSRSGGRTANSAGRNVRPARGSMPVRSRARRRRRKINPAKIIIPLMLIVFAFALCYNLVSAWIISRANASTYLDNIRINDIELTSFTREAGIDYVHSVIDARLNSVHTLTWEDQSWSFTAADFNATMEVDSILERVWNIGHVGSIFDCKSAVQSLKEAPISLNAKMEYDESRINAFVDSIYNAVYIAPQDAMVVVDMDKPYLASESTRGQELDRETAVQQIISILETGEESAVLPVVLLDPVLDTETAMNSLDVIVEYKTDVSARGYNSRYNIRKGLSYFNGMEVHPGETIDFNERVGPRSKERGWQSAPEYLGGITQDGYGGGICQVSTTLYGALMKAGMTIIERHPHSMTVAYVEPSLDAAVYDTGSRNLVFRNDTDTSIFIYTDVNKEYATVRICGARPPYRYELESKILSQSTEAVRVKYIADTEGKYCFYLTDTKLYKKGHAECTSEGWIVAYDWDTGEEVSRTQLSMDIYSSGIDLYWRGVHTEDGSVATAEDVAKLNL